MICPFCGQEYSIRAPAIQERDTKNIPVECRSCGRRVVHEVHRDVIEDTFKWWCPDCYKAIKEDE